MTTREQIITEARTWIGTPWHHQASLKGVGCDCGGLIRGVMSALGMADADHTQWPDAEKFLGYSRWPDGKSLIEACNRFLIPIEKEVMQPADIVLLIVENDPQHLCILSNYIHGGLSIIHSVVNANVTETRFMTSKIQRIVAAFAFPGVG